jgi:heme exporter protein A
MVAIRGLHISRSYGHYRILEDLSFEIAAGECYALFGANGAGKTTLLRILATLHRPSAGRLEILGRDAIREREVIREALLLLAHGSHLYDELNAAENLNFALALRAARPTDQDVKVALDRVGIGAYAELKVRYFSAGMKKRLAMAKAMLAQPKVLLLDEPYSSLDEAGMVIMNQYIQDLLKEGASVVMATHDRIKSAEVAHRAGVLRQGALHPLTIKDLKTHELS